MKLIEILLAYESFSEMGQGIRSLITFINRACFYLQVPVGHTAFQNQCSRALDSSQAVKETLHASSGGGKDEWN